MPPTFVPRRFLVAARLAAAVLMVMGAVALHATIEASAASSSGTLTVADPAPLTTSTPAPRSLTYSTTLVSPNGVAATACPDGIITVDAVNVLPGHGSVVPVVPASIPGSVQSGSTPVVVDYLPGIPGTDTITVDMSDNCGGAGSSTITASYFPGPSGPTNQTAPTAIGIPKVGQTLTADPGTWNSEPPVTYAFTWVRCTGPGTGCDGIPAATATISLTSGDVGSYFKVGVAATNGGGSSAPTYSSVVGPVTEAAPSPPTPPEPDPPTIAPTTATPTNPPAPAAPVITPPTIPPTSTETAATTPPTAPPQTTTPPRDDTISASTTTTAPAPVQLTVKLSAEVGDTAAGSQVTASGTGLAPASTTSLFAHSTPALLGTATVDQAGTFSSSATMPAGLEAGDHRLVVEGTSSDGSSVNNQWAFTVAADGTFTAIDQALTSGSPTVASTTPSSTEPVTTLPAWRAADHPAQVIDTQAGAFVLLSVVGLAGVGAAAAGAIGATSGATATRVGGSSRKRKSGKVTSAKVKNYKFSHDGDHVGDASFTWHFPGQSIIDRWSLALPQWLAPRSPLAGRIANDGGYLRAMFGSLAAATPIVGLVFGVAFSVAAHGKPLPPSFWWVAALVVLGVMDSLAGAVAVVVLSAVCLATGNVDSADALRGLLGLGVLGFAVPLIASAARPLRRPPADDAAGWWCRGTDWVAATLFGAWAASKMLTTLPGLTGLDLPVARLGDRLAVVVGIALLGRLAAETVAANFYPRRLDAVSVGKLPFSSARQRLASLVLKTALFVFVSVTFIDATWALIAGTVLFVIPQVAGIHEHRFPNSPKLYRVLPRGLLKVVLMMFVCTAWATVLTGWISDPKAMVAIGFVTMGTPGLLEGALGLIGRDGPPATMTWPLRFASVGVVWLGITYTRGVALSSSVTWVPIAAALTVASCVWIAERIQPSPRVAPVT